MQLERLIMHWNGSAWSIVDHPLSSTLHERIGRLSGSASDDVWGLTDWGELLRWNGASWVVYDHTGYATIGAGHALWVSGQQDVWAVGGAGDGALHWIGEAGSELPSSADAANSLYGVHGVSPGDVWAVGSAGTTVHLPQA